MGFFITNPGLNANGYMFRVENGGDCGFFEVINGVHGNIIGTPLGVAGAPVDVWLEVRIQVVGSTATAIVRRNDNNAKIGNTATVTLPAGNRQGTFGQKHDGAGGSNGHRWDNIVLVSPGSAVANNPASTTTGLVASDSDKAMVFNRGSRGTRPVRVVDGPASHVGVRRDHPGSPHRRLADHRGQVRRQPERQLRQLRVDLPHRQPTGNSPGTSSRTPTPSPPSRARRRWSRAPPTTWR